MYREMAKKMFAQAKTNWKPKEKPYTYNPTRTEEDKAFFKKYQGWGVEYDDSTKLITVRTPGHYRTKKAIEARKAREAE